MASLNLYRGMKRKFGCITDVARMTKPNHSGYISTDARVAKQHMSCSVCLFICLYIAYVMSKHTNTVVCSSNKIRDNCVPH